MRYESIADIYSANKLIRERFQATVADIGPDEENGLTEGEQWTPGHLVEHVSIVYGGMAGICGKLIGKAKDAGAVSDGTIAISPDYFSRLGSSAERKVEAPERVRPTGGVPLAESIQRLAAADQALVSMRDDFEAVGLDDHKFPHPLFGDLTAVEWLILAGLHEHRHTGQLQEMIAKIRQ